MKSIGRRRKGSLNCRKYWGERAAFHLTPIGSNKSYVFRGFYHGPRDVFAVTTLPLFSHIPLRKPKFYRAPRVFEHAPKIPIIRLTIEIICSIYTLLRLFIFAHVHAGRVGQLLDWGLKYFRNDRSHLEILFDESYTKQC